MMMSSSSSSSSASASASAFCFCFWRTHTHITISSILPLTLSTLLVYYYYGFIPTLILLVSLVLLPRLSSLSRPQTPVLAAGTTSTSTSTSTRVEKDEKPQIINNNILLLQPKQPSKPTSNIIDHHNIQHQFITSSTNGDVDGRLSSAGDVECDQEGRLSSEFITTTTTTTTTTTSTHDDDVDGRLSSADADVEYCEEEGRLSSESSELDYWPFQGNMFQSPDDCFDAGYISDEDTLIEIALPARHFILRHQHYPCCSTFFNHKLMVMDDDDVPDEDNLIEIDISLGSIY